MSFTSFQKPCSKSWFQSNNGDGSFFLDAADGCSGCSHWCLWPYTNVSKLFYNIEERQSCINREELLSLLHEGLGYLNITSLVVLSLLFGFLYATRLAYNYIYNPLEHYLSEAELAYHIDRPPKGRTTDEIVREMKQRRDIGDIPPVYPNGWFVVIRSDELKKGESKCVNVLGR